MDEAKVKEGIAAVKAALASGSAAATEQALNELEAVAEGKSDDDDKSKSAPKGPTGATGSTGSSSTTSSSTRSSS
jgi:hypothetical protein